MDKERAVFPSNVSASHRCGFCKKSKTTDIEILKFLNTANNSKYVLKTAKIFQFLQGKLTYIYIYIYIYMCVCVCVCICMYICIYIQVYIHTHIRIAKKAYIFYICTNFLENNLAVFELRSPL